MKIGILSDSHDHVEHTKKAIELFNDQKVELIIHCGDFCSPFMMPLFKNFNVVAVFGNNDGDIFLLSKKAEEAHVQLKGGFWETEMLGKKIAVYHGTYESITKALVYSGLYDLVITGHTHKVVQEKVGKTWSLNPGTVHGFGGDSTVMIVNVVSDDIQVEQICLED